jgi:class 3 adenylate cyclase
MALARKTVTILFADIADSTRLGERLDPEVTRHIMVRYFEEGRNVLERHGGTVEKFIGDAVMAVFGVPAVHEDDALRAVRAADELRKRLAAVNEELVAEWGVRFETRMGLNTGEVVAGEGGTLVTGDAVNVAARLQQAAEPGETLLGAETQRLVEHAVEAERVDDIVARGKRDLVPAWRLKSVRTGVPTLAPRALSPFVGRTQELGALEAALAGAVDARRCELVTVVGHPGSGKSRLALEFASRHPEARFVTGRCLPYGDGVAFWPVAEIVRQLAGIAASDPAEAARAKVGSLLPDSDGPMGERIAYVVGLAAGSATGDEVFFALRRLFEGRPAGDSLVLVFEDIHWAEPTLLDLLEYLAGWSRDAPIVLLCLARPDLLDMRPSWAGRANLMLEGLNEQETHRLVTHLAPGLNPELGRRVEETAEGNPLFVEELLSMLQEDGNGDSLAIPPTITAVLSARFDRLAPGERTILQSAAVIGKQFWWSAVAELASPELRPDVGGYLQSLVRKRLVFPEPPTLLAGEDAFRFGHILIRDTAYHALSKMARAELHEQFARWLERKVGDRVAEYEEILGHHLERAFSLRSELSALDAAARRVGERAAELLAAAGRRAAARGDAGTAAGLLGRASVLPYKATEHIALLVDLGVALKGSGDLTGSEEALNRALEAARSVGDRRGEARAMVERALTQIYTLAGALDEIAVNADRAEAMLAACDDEAGVAKALTLRGEVELIRCRIAASEELLERALVHARGVGDEQQVQFILNLLSRAVLVGPIPVPAAIARCSAIRRHAPSDRMVDASVTMSEATLEAMRGDFEVARALSARSRAVLEELGRPISVAIARMTTGEVELLAGDAEAAEIEFRAGVETLRAVGERGTLSTVAAYLAEALHLRNEDDEAEQYTEVSEEASFADDVLSQVLWRNARAKIQCRRGELDSAERLAREAAALTERTDDLTMAGSAFATLATVLRAAGHTAEATAASRRAVELFERKGHVVAAEAARGEHAERTIRA